MSDLFVGGLVLSRKIIPPNMNQKKNTDQTLVVLFKERLLQEEEKALRVAAV